MKKYKLTQGWPQHVESTAFVNPETNAEYLEWLAEGNVPDPADPLPEPEPEPTLVDQVLADPAALSALKKALGI